MPETKYKEIGGSKTNFSFYQLRQIFQNVGIKIVKMAMQSLNFVTGSLGWRLTGEGNFEGNEGTFRGALTANSINIPDVSTSNSFHADSSGNVWWGATTLANSLASILSTGVAKFIGASTLDIISTTIFEAVGRFGINAVIGSGAITFGNQGVQIKTGATATSSARLRWGGMADVMGANVIFSTTLSITDLDNGSVAFFGAGTPTVTGSDITLTGDHIGFKIVSGSLYATQASGGVATVSSALTTVSVNNTLELIFKIGSGSVEYFWRLNNNSISAVTKLTSTLPTGATYTQFCVSNKDIAAETTYQLYAASLKR